MHIHDVLADPEYRWARQQGAEIRTILAVPMLREATVIGVIVVRRTEVQPFTDKQVELVTTFADQAVIAIENVRLFQELEGRNKDLTESLEQQTATSEILKVISSSPTDVQPVFDTIAANSLRLCVARWSAVYPVRRPVIELVSLHGLTDPAGIEALRRAFPRPPSRAGATDRAILARTIVHVRDVREDPEYQWHELAQSGGLSKPAVCPDAPRGAAHRGDHSRWSLTWQLLRAAGRPAENLCRPGGHRDRERPSLPGARCAQPRPHRSARAADGDQRGPASVISRSTFRPPAGPRTIAGRERDAPLRSADRRSIYPVRR